MPKQRKITLSLIREPTEVSKKLIDASNLPPVTGLEVDTLTAGVDFAQL